MPHSRVLNIEEQNFLNRFLKGQISPSDFSHERHLKLAWIYIIQYGEQVAIEKFSEDLFQFVKNIGEESIFNLTLTVASIKIVSHYMAKSNSSSFSFFLLEFPQLNQNFKSLIHAHYSPNIINSLRAKSELIEPDIIPF